jgi:hypothetical protein
VDDAHAALHRLQFELWESEPYSTKKRMRSCRRRAIGISERDECKRGIAEPCARRPIQESEDATVSDRRYRLGFRRSCLRMSKPHR